MKKDVKIRITGVHGRGKDKNTVVSEYAGLFYEKDDVLYVKYSETDEESKEIRNSLIKIEGKNVTVSHKGHTDAKMIYELGKTTRTTYVTPMGSMLLEIKTNSVSIEQSEEMLLLKLGYEMSFGETEKTPAEIRVEVRS